MVTKTQIWLDQALTFPAEMPGEGGLAVQAPTLLMESVQPEDSALEESATNQPQAPSPNAEEEQTQKTPAKPAAAPNRSSLRHLAGANWLDDWTAFFPTTVPEKAGKKRKKPRKPK